ncbi:Ni/Fe-hydrogenase cytochrome b subunit [bacterium]|nr:Ni/Fe-hydrogenase cytochrome b subunit [bacterium]
MRLHIFKSILWFIVGLAVPVMIMRFIHGLGATTNLNDVTPWGFWIGFKVAGIALAAGGFVIAATVYIFQLKEFKAIVRPAILTAFLGYILVALALVIDLGVPWHIWHPMIYWQHHSALFEVAWCVMLYLTVLSLEFLPVVLEKLPFKKVLLSLRRWTLVLVIMGIMLSTLHQSSLGTLFLIMPFRLNQLWYSPLLPLLFFISAIALGLGLIITEFLLSSWLYRQKVEWRLLEKLAKVTGVVIGIYALIRLGDLLFRGEITLGSLSGWEGGLFLFEMLLSVLGPVLIFLRPTWRANHTALTWGAIFTVLGVVLHRLNVSGIATITATRAIYVPSWMEFAISFGLIAGAGLVFLFFVENLSVYESPPVQKNHHDQKAPYLFWDDLTQVRLGWPWLGSFQLYSLVLVMAIALGAALLPENALWGPKPVRSPTQPARLVRVTAQLEQQDSPGHLYSLADPTGPDKSRAELLEMLLINGNRNNDYVIFPHQAHIGLLGQQDSCRLCHHLNKPLDWASPCYQCHADMFESTDIFDHKLHIQTMGDNDSCQKCHRDRSLVHSKANSVPCSTCHQNMKAEDSLISTDEDDEQRFAPGYMNALHDLCLPCHQDEEQLEPDWEDRLSLCSRCHQTHPASENQF